MSGATRPALEALVAPLAGGAGPFESELSLTVPSDVALVEEAVELVAGRLEPVFRDQHAVRFNLRIALTEALTNGILYGNLSNPVRSVAVRARFGPNLIELEVTDEGDGFDPAAVPDPRAPDRLERPYGRGLYLIRNLMDEVRHNEVGNSIRMVLRRPTPLPPAAAPPRRTRRSVVAPEVAHLVERPVARERGRLDPVLAALAGLLDQRLGIWKIEAATSRLVAGETASANYIPRYADLAQAGSEGSGLAMETPSGTAWLEPLPGHEATWLELESVPQERRAALPTRARAAASVMADILRGEQEASAVASELATRYEEIDLLYTISDILGRTVRLEEAARLIVTELAEVMGARRASIMVHEEASDTLRVVAGRGLEMYHLRPVPVGDQDSIAARVFREQELLAYDHSTPAPPRGFGGRERGYKGGSFVSLPITYAPPGGTPRRVGVINLTDKMGGESFTASHKRLLTAVANQVGAAMENARMVEGERRRVRLDTELALAHELQSALMQPASVLGEVGDIGVRVQSADAVGGDFYRIVSLRSGELGVMLGDVSSHGLTAAMIMAHAIAAAGIVAQTSRDAAEALERLLEVIGDELKRTEMHLALFYGILDRRRGVLRYANAGHPQAFLVHGAGGVARRLEATAPPLGLGLVRSVKGEKIRWKKGEDLLCLFTDGISETSDEAGARYGETRLLEVVRRQAERPANEIVDAVFTDLERFSGSGPGADDRTLVIVRG